MPTQYENLGLILDSSTCAYRALVSTTMTRAISLTSLKPDLCWSRVTTIVLYYGIMIRDHEVVSKPRVSFGLQP
jgi:hypothetical protein